MAGEHDRVVGERGEALQAVVHRLGVAAGQVGAPAAVEEQRVAGDEAAVDEEALAARACGPGVCTSSIVDRADGDDVAGLVGGQLVSAMPVVRDDPRRLGALHVDRARRRARAGPATPSIVWPIIDPPTWSGW